MTARKRKAAPTLTFKEFFALAMIAAPNVRVYQRTHSTLSIVVQGSEEAQAMGTLLNGLFPGNAYTGERLMTAGQRDGWNVPVPLPKSEFTLSRYKLKMRRREWGTISKAPDFQRRRQSMLETGNIAVRSSTYDTMAADMAKEIDNHILDALVYGTGMLFDESADIPKILPPAAQKPRRE